MAKRVHIPGVGAVNFPDELSEAQIGAEIGKLTGAPAAAAPQEEPGILQKVLSMVRGTPGNVYGEVERVGEAGLRSILPGGGTFKQERNKIRTSEGLSLDPTERAKQIDKITGTFRFNGSLNPANWSATPGENVGYEALGVVPAMGVMKAGSLPAAPTFPRSAAAAERTGARSMLQSLRAPENDVAMLRQRLGSPGGDVGVDAGRVLRDMVVPSTGERVAPAIALPRTRNARLSQVVEEKGPRIAEAVDATDLKNPRAVRVQDLLDEVGGAAGDINTRAERAVAGEKNIERINNLAKQIKDEYQKARETAANIKYQEPAQGELGMHATTVQDPGTPGLRAGVPTKVVGVSRELPEAAVVESPGYRSTLPKSIEIEAPLRNEKGQIVRQGRYATNRQGPSQPPGYEQPQAGEMAPSQPRSVAEAGGTPETARLQGGQAGERPVMQQQLDPAFYGEQPPLFISDATGRPMLPEQGGTRYQGTNRPQPGAPVHVNLEHAPAVPHEGTPTTAVQGELFASPKYPEPPPGTGGTPGGPVHVSSNVEHGPSMSPKELHEFVQRIDKEVWQTASERNPTRPQAAIDASPDLQYLQKVGKAARVKLEEAVSEALGTERGNQFRLDKRDFEVAKANEPSVRSAADREAGGMGQGERGLSPYSLRHTLPLVGAATGNPMFAAGGLAADVGLILHHKFGPSVIGRGLGKLSDTLYKSEIPTQGLAPQTQQALVAQYIAARLREKKERK
jgi:hypothetical protein